MKGCLIIIQSLLSSFNTHLMVVRTAYQQSLSKVNWIKKYQNKRVITQIMPVLWLVWAMPYLRQGSLSMGTGSKTIRPSWITLLCFGLLFWGLEVGAFWIWARDECWGQKTRIHGHTHTLQCLSNSHPCDETLLLVLTWFHLRSHVLDCYSYS